MPDETNDVVADHWFPPVPCELWAGNQMAPERVAVAWGPAAYDASFAFCPDTAFPEYPFAASTASCPANRVYATVRESLHLLGLDASRYSSRIWNPLRALICPGDTVLVKPNFVRHFRETYAGHGDCLITHGAVIRAVLDYVFVALRGQGRIIVADAPQDDADFDALCQMAGLHEIQRFYRRHADFPIEVYDLRQERARKVDGVICGHVSMPGDPAGYVKVNLGMDSAFAEINHLCHLLYGAKFDTGELRRHHHDGVHEYLLSKTVLAADCIINLPKLKTHKKTGVTLCMKNFVGVNGNKNWLPHHREGTPAQGGDQFADSCLLRRAERLAIGAFRHLFPLLGPLRAVAARPLKAVGKRVFGDTNTDTVRSGNWYGNDTTWRMVIDLVRAVTYADAQGDLQDRPARHLLNVVDGIIAGEGNGPLDPVARPCGIILTGTSPLAVDLVCTRLMGFDYQKIPLLRNSLQPHNYPFAPVPYHLIRCASNRHSFNCMITNFNGPGLAFIPHFGWRGHIEV